MEANICDINYLDADVLLPPRKRLLACLKKQNADGNSYMQSTSCSSNEFDSHLNNLLRSHLNNHDLSLEEIVEASRSAAEVAVKVAKAARAVAEEKAAIAAKAVTVAKNALELVAIISEEETASTDRYLKKNKIKKHVQVQMLYHNKKQRVKNYKTDEELARKLHQAINSSPRIMKSCSSSNLKSHKHKRLKSLAFSENSKSSNGGIVREGNFPSTSNGNSIALAKEGYIVKVDASKSNKADMSKMENGESERIQSKEIFVEEDSSTTLGRKRGRMKQKKLPLSICNFRDQANPKEDLKSRSSEFSDNPLFPAGPSGNNVIPVERTSLCQAFKASSCIKPNKVMQS